MKYSFFLALFLVKTFPAMGALTDETIIVWGEKAAVASHPVSAPLSLPKSWTLSETQDWMATPPIKKVWPAFFKVLQRIPIPDYVRMGRTEFCHDESLKVISGTSISWYKGATVSSGKFFVTHSGLIQSALNDGTLLQGLKEAKNADLLPLIRMLE